jgi:hypothetical protein
MRHAMEQGMATQVIIPARYCPFPRWWMLVYCLAGFLLALGGVLLSEPGHAGFLVLMLLILLRAPLQTLANRSETIIDSHARERGWVLRKTGLLGTRHGPKQATRELDISPYRYARATLVANALGLQLDLELGAPGQPPLQLSQATYFCFTRQQRRNMVRTYRNMSRKVAQILQIEDRGLHRYGNALRHTSRRGT